MINKTHKMIMGVGDFGVIKKRFNITYYTNITKKVSLPPYLYKKTKCN